MNTGNLPKHAFGLVRFRYSRLLILANGGLVRTDLCERNEYQEYRGDSWCRVSCLCLLRVTSLGASIFRSNDECVSCQKARVWPSGWDGRFPGISETDAKLEVRPCTGESLGAHRIQPTSRRLALIPRQRAKISHDTRIARQRHFILTPAIRRQDVDL